MRLLALALVLAAGPALAEAPARVTSAGARQSWRAAEIEIVLDPSLDELAEPARAAFGAWIERAPLPRVTFTVARERGEAARDGVSRVLATRDAALGHERDLAYTVSYADAATGEILEADVVFNLRYDFGAIDPPCKRVWDPRVVATHEAGHFFGLAEDVTVKSATMWFEVPPCDASKRDLSEPDVRAIRALYAPPPTRAMDALLPEPRGCAVAGRTGDGPEGGAAWALALALYGLAQKRAGRTGGMVARPCRASTSSPRCR